ncbi:hypothetical protein V8E51_005252 [Hyaloscypha variabilis]|uniref:Fungal N-terminal domain-containing protein n=1 Tax=Hyaloscypha variabilis (strain UAMH 11265 / GT02V1 / F) TaxID=1149755 RepID=A0A2J6S4R1_HYAVF|nr:hypothetical protein L207DRAFT_259401 [Hyaloscypha variabilis F]
MSFSISISEFIAVGQLAERLYKDVCLVRHASQELLALQNEVATSNTSINLLIADIKDKTSTLARSGEERVNVVNGVLAETKKTLLELEKFSQNFRGDQRNAGAFGKVKSVLSKAKYVGELSKIDALRARLQHQNGNLTLLLMCAGNSSLQRIETVDQKMNADITKLTKMMAQLTHEAPDDSGLSYKSPLTPNFLAQAENGGRRWFSYGFDEWLRAGQWWLMSSQGQLDPEITSDLVIPIQPYADLLKASSILLDILPRHPSIRLWDPTKEYLQFQLLADMLRDELNAIKTRGLKTPDLQSLQEADLRIWTETVTTVQLRPDAHGHRSSWEDANEEILWQGFGTFVYDRDFKPKACMILVLVSKNIDKARILVQNQRGFELISLRIDFNLLFAKPLPGDSGFRSDSISGNSEIEFYFPDCRKPLGDGLKTIGLGQIEISLSSKRDLGELSCTLRGIVFCQHIQGVQKDHALLHGVILLFIQAYGDVALGRKSLALHQKRRCLEFYKCEESSILHVAEMAAQEFSQHTELFVSNHPPRFVDFKQWRSAYNSDFDQPIVESQNMFDWAYGILIGPALLGLSLRAFDSMSFCSDNLYTVRSILTILAVLTTTIFGFW